jgi:hypothetical protein
VADFTGTLFTVLFLNSLFFGFIGTIIDGNKGFWWGLFLGPLGIIIAAILKKDRKNTENQITYLSENSSQISNPNHLKQTSSRKEIPNNKFSDKKWEILKQVDPDISAAAEKVRSVDVNLEDDLAEKYLILGQKDYLHQIVDAIIKSHELKTAKRNSLEVLEYEDYIGKEKFDARYGLKVLDIQVYNGSWKNWQGGIIVKFSDGKTLLEKKGVSRIFQKDDASWN